MQWALAVELATSRWVNTTLVDIDPHLPALLDTERLRTVDDIDTWLNGVEAMAGESAAAHPAEACTPEILLTAQPPTPGHLRRLRAATLAAPTGLPVAIIAAATENHRFPTEWDLDTTPEKHVTLPELGRTVTLQRATPEDQANLTTLLAAAHEPDEPDPAWTLVPTEPAGPPTPHTDLGPVVSPADLFGDEEALPPPRSRPRQSPRPSAPRTRNSRTHPHHRNHRCGSVTPEHRSSGS